MTAVFAMRLFLDLVAAGLLVFGLSYWWLGDAAHEAAGVGLLLLVLLHNVFNRRWYGTAARIRHGPARLVPARLVPASLFNVGVTLVLGVAMLLLFGTSAMITTMLPEWVPMGAAATARQLHVLAAYWAFVVVAVHLGLRWPVIMAATRGLLGIARPNRWRRIGLRLATAGIAVQGVRSFGELGLWPRLTMRMSLDWWNFEEAVLGFFLHAIAVAGLLIALSHYTARWLRAVRAASGDPVAQRVDQQGQGR